MANTSASIGVLKIPLFDVRRYEVLTKVRRGTLPAYLATQDVAKTQCRLYGNSVLSNMCVTSALDITQRSYRAVLGKYGIVSPGNK